MDSSQSDQVQKIPAWAEEQFLEQLRSGQKDVARLIDSIARQFPEICDTVTAYLRLLAFVEQGQPRTRSTAADIPAQIGPYRVDRIIGHGGMGVVVAAHDSDGFGVAIKILHPERRLLLERFRREASTIAALNHPGIVKLRSFHDDGTLPYLVMDLVSGVSLDVLLKSAPGYTDSALAADHGMATPLTTAAESDRPGESESAAEREASRSLIGSDFFAIARLGEQVADALVHTHARGIIHRDIKPANIIFNPNGRACITDFGLARPVAAFDSFTVTGDLIGTPRYMAPEQLRGIADERCDIYSLGVTLWELCTGRCAWVTPVEGHTSGWNLPPVHTLQPHVPGAMSQLISECCAFDPSQRPTADRLRDRLRAAALDHPPSRIGRRRLLAGALLAAGCCLTAVGLSDWWPDSSGSPFPKNGRRLKAETAAPALDSPRIVDVAARSGQTLLDLRRLEIPLPSEGLSARIVGGRDADLFRIDLSSQLCARSEDACSARKSLQREVELEIRGSRQRSWIAIDDYREPFTTLLISDGQTDQKTVIRDTQFLPLSRTIGLASADGRNFYTTLVADSGEIALWTFRIASNGTVTGARRLSTNCRLPSGVEAFSTRDGETFYVCGYRKRTDYSSRKPLVEADRFLWEMKLQPDGTFKMMRDRRLPLQTQCVWHLAVMSSGVYRIGWLADGLPMRGWMTETKSGLVVSAFGTRGRELEALADWPVGQSSAAERVLLRIKPLSCAAYGAIAQSRKDGAPRTISVYNDSQVSLKIFWVGSDGALSLLHTLLPGAMHRQQTYVGHTLDIVHEQHLWDRFTVIEEMPEIVIAQPRQFRERAAW